MSEGDVGFSLREFAEKMRERGRTVSIWVEGDTGRDPPQGRAASIRAANAIMPEHGSFVEPQKEGSDVDLSDFDTLLFTLYPEQDPEDLEPIRRVLQTNKAMLYNVIVHANEVPCWTLKLCDVRISVGDNGVTSIHRLFQNDYAGEMLEQPLDGFTGGPYEA